MNFSIQFTRIFFFFLSIFFMEIYAISSSDELSGANLLYGMILGSVLGAVLIGFDLLFKRFHLRSFNIATLGLFFGYLMGQALVLILSAVLDISATLSLSAQSLEIVKISLLLFGTYLGTLMTLRASNELYISIPFVKLTAMAQKKKDLILDASILHDARIVDLASSGLLDHHLVLPRFIVKDLYDQMEASTEGAQPKIKRALDVIKRLEALSDLELRYNNTDFPEMKDPMAKLIRLARLLDANLLTSDLSRVQTAAIEGIKVINLHTLSNALKPLMQTGEQIKIKIQRYGKEPKQGVGYLEDGTMVVVNGGGDFIGEMVDAQVLSVKHTASGRMIFCNAVDLEGNVPAYQGNEGEEQ